MTWRVHGLPRSAREGMASSLELLSLLSTQVSRKMIDSRRCTSVVVKTHAPSPGNFGVSGLETGPATLENQTEVLSSARIWHCSGKM